MTVAASDSGTAQVAARASVRTARRRSAPWTVLGVGLGLTLALTVLGNIGVSAKDDQRFEQGITDIREDVHRRLDSYLTALNAASGLFAAAPQTRHAGFAAFARSVDLRSRFRGLQGLGFAPRVSRAAVPAFVAEMRREGISAYHVWPTSAQPWAVPVGYLEPEDDRNRVAIGYDMFSETARRAAMLRAAETAAPVATARVTLVQEITSRPQAGFLIYRPLYRGGDVPATGAARRAVLEGYVYAAIRADDMFGGFPAVAMHPDLDLQLFDGPATAADALLHDSARGRDAEPRGFRPHFVRRTDFQLAGRTWTLMIRSRQAFERMDDRNMVWILCGAGTILSVGLFTLTRSRALSEARTESYAQTLSDRQAEIEALNERLRRAMVETHHRVKNNLQLLTAMLDMRLMDEHATIPATELHRLNAHIKALAAVHDLLTQRARDDGEARLVSARDMLEKLLPLLDAGDSRRISSRLDDVLLTSRQATSLALVTNELVSNALKHGGSRADVSLDVTSSEAAGATACLTVADDGPGLPPGFDPAASASVGLELVENLTGWDLGGRTAYTSGPGGARITVTFPLGADIASGAPPTNNGSQGIRATEAVTSER